MAEKIKPIEFSTEKRKLGELTPYEHNPRLLTKPQYDQLKRSLVKFGLVEIPVVDRKNRIMAGHQRISILKEMNGDDYVIDVRVPKREVTEEEFQEYLIKSNKIKGEFDMDILGNVFDVSKLLDFGFSKVELGLAEKKEPDEKCIVIVCKDKANWEELKGYFSKFDVDTDGKLLKGKSLKKMEKLVINGASFIPTKKE